MGNQTILWIDQIAFARIENSPQCLKFIVRDDEGSHLSVWKKDDDYRFEFSSNKPLGSVWDDARRGIARDHPDCSYRDWGKHANYVVNRTMDLFADSDVPLISMAMPRKIKPAKPSLRSIPAVCLQAPASDYWLSLYFSPSRSTVIPNSVVFEGQIGRLVIGLADSVHPYDMLE
jgi:hypothetical protein